MQSTCNNNVLHAFFLQPALHQSSKRAQPVLQPSVPQVLYFIAQPLYNK